jgi:ABC-2 type transport system ATP-binding protein
MISVDRLTKYYADHLALDRVTFDVDAGDVVGFLGPNGAGKSTAMKIITCFLPPSSGTATVAGFDIIRDPMNVRRHIGYMPESVPLYGEMRVHEYLAFRAKLKDVPRKERAARVDKVMERAWLTHVQRQTVGTLSKGYRQRVGLADAMVGDPDVLILDEPTIGLDPTQVRQVRQLVRELGTDHTVLISTHILTEVEAVCDKVIIISQGRIAAGGSLASLQNADSGVERYYLELQAPGDQAAAALSSISGVADVRGHGPHEAGGAVCGFAFEVGRGSGAAEAAVALAVSKGWKVRELRRRERTLEDIFVEIVGRDQAASV